MLVALPAYAGLAVVAPALVPVLLGEKWLGVVPLLPILTIAISMLTLQILFAPATNACGVPQAALRITMIGSMVMPCTFLIGSQWGMTGLAWGWVCGMAVLTTATVTLSGLIFGLTLSGLADALAPPLAAALMMGAGVALALAVMPPLLPLAQLVLAVLLGVALYFSALRLIAPGRVAEALHFVRTRGESEPVPTT